MGFGFGKLSSWTDDGEKGAAEMSKHESLVSALSTKQDLGNMATGSSELQAVRKIMIVLLVFGAVLLGQSRAVIASEAFRLTNSQLDLVTASMGPSKGVSSMNALQQWLQIFTKFQTLILTIGKPVGPIQGIFDLGSISSTDSPSDGLDSNETQGFDSFQIESSGGLTAAAGGTISSKTGNLSTWTAISTSDDIVSSSSFSSAHE